MKMKPLLLLNAIMFLWIEKTVNLAAQVTSCDFDGSMCGFTQDKSDKFDWRRRTGSTSTGKTGPSADHTTGTGHYMYIETSLPRVQGDNARLNSPPLNFSGDMCLQFVYHMYGSSIGTLTVTINNTIEVLSATGNHGNLWLESRTTISISGMHTVTFEGVRGSSYRGDIAIDDFSLSEGSCLKVTSCDFDGSLCGFSQDNNDKFDWTLQTGSTSTRNTGPTADHTTASGYYMYIETSSPRIQGDNAKLNSPPLNFNGNMCLEFFYHMYGANTGTLKVIINGTKTVFSATGYNVNGWRRSRRTVTFLGLYTLTFEGIRGNGYYGDIAIDDFSLSEGSCPPTYCNFDDSICGFTQDKNDIFDWTRHNGTTPTGEISGKTGPFADHTSAAGYYMYIETSSPRVKGDNAKLNSPLLNFTGDMCLEFFYHMFGSNIGALKVTLNVTETVFSATGNLGDGWLESRTTISLSGIYMVTFEGIRGFGHAGDIAIDDFSLSEGSCPVVTSCDFDESMCGFKQNQDDKFDWTRHTGRTSLGKLLKTGPSFDHTSGGGFYLYINTGYPRVQGDNAKLSSPLLNFTGQMCLKFFYHMYGSGIGTLRTIINGTKTVFTATGNQADGWLKSSKTFAFLGMYKVTFEGIRGKTPPGYIAIDDFALRDGPCPYTKPEITTPGPGTVLRTVESHLVRCIAIGPLPIFTALVWNSTVLVNSTDNVEIRLYKEGNYSCVATNKYGSATRVIPYSITIGCGSVVNNTLSSPGYPKKYPEYMHCIYKVPIPKGMVLKIHFEVFYLKCRNGYLSITDKNNNALGKFCDELIFREVLIDEDLAVITFHSDYIVSKQKGFMLSFTAVQFAIPKIILQDPAPVVRACARCSMWCSAFGILPLNVTLARESITLVTAPRTAEIHLSRRGNYTCAATDKYGNHAKANFSVIFSDCKPQCAVSVDYLDGNTFTCKNVTSFAPVIKCAPTITENLDLSSNFIKLLPEDVFTKLYHLKYLDLSSNALTVLPNDVFAILTDLRQLDLRSNAIQVLPEVVFANLKRLSTLHLSSNAITELPEDVFANLRELKELYLSSNSITLLPVAVFAGLKDLWRLYLSSNTIAVLSESVFANLIELRLLYLSSNAITVLPERVFASLTQLRELNLSSNAIKVLSERVFANLIHLRFLYLSSNAISVLPETLFASLVKLETLDLSSNAIRVLPEGFFAKLNLYSLDLSSNVISFLPDGMFAKQTRIVNIFVRNNNISNISSATFAKNKKLESLFLSGNSLMVIPYGAFKHVHLKYQADQTIMLSDNPIETIGPEAFALSNNLVIFLLRTMLKKLSLESFIGLSGLYAQMLIEDSRLRTLKYTINEKLRCIIYLSPHESEPIKVLEDKNILISSLVATGFTRMPNNDTLYDYYLPCPVGTFSDSSSQGVEGCIPCPPGGFYSDDVGYVNTSCKECPNGSFVAFDKAPGKQAQDCKTCPLGTDSDLHAGFRACACLKGHYRTHMFEQCHKCGEGLKCQDEYATLKSGYWWRWKSKTHKDRYRAFIRNLLAHSSALHKDNVSYPYPVPIPYKCPEEYACKGGIDSSCEHGYGGPLCSVCTKGHYKQFNQCKKCPSMAWTIGQLSIIAALLLIILAISVWTSKIKNKKEEGERFSIDTFLSKIKIAIGFYQVTYGLQEAFSYIEWPESVRVIGKYSEILQFNILQMAPVHCLFPEIRADAFANLFSIMAINAAIIVFAGVTYVARKVIISKSTNLEGDEKSKKISQIKEKVSMSMFFFLYITYLSTCSKTTTVLPLACRKLCQDEKENFCLEYLKADYSIQCQGPWYNKLVVFAYVSSVYVLALPVAAFIALWRRRRVILATAQATESEDVTSSTEITKAMNFLYKNYNARSWYWELVEMSRKVIITSGLILVGQESRSYIGLAWVISGMYGIVFAWNHPIQDAFENRLLTVSVAVTVFNLGVGAVSKIPTENLLESTDSYMDTVIFNVLVLGANTLVVGILAFQYLMHLYGYFKEWRKNPQWSFSCCLALILPLISLPGDVSGLASTNMLNNQLDSGNIEMPTITAAVQDSGSIDIGLEEHEQSDENPVESHDDNRIVIKQETGKMPTAAVQGNGTVELTIKETEEGHCNPKEFIPNDNPTEAPSTDHEIVVVMQDSETAVKIATERGERGDD